MDCMEGMKGFPDNYFDLAIVDPPYGINITGRHKCGALVGGGGGLSAVTGGYGKGRPPIGGGDHEGAVSLLKVPSKFYRAFDDSLPPDESYFAELRRVSRAQIIWGANFLLDHLGRTSCMIVWDKGRRGMDQADCEIAWTSLPGQSRIFDFKWNGMLQGDMKNKEERFHPTQKPVRLYEWILKNFAHEGDRILDTHVGSASSLIACHRGGYSYWGFEIDPEYYRMASERLEREKAQVSIFDMGQGALL